MCAEIPFVGRKVEISRLRNLHAVRKHALIFGLPGIGKTELVRQMSGLAPLLISAHSDTMRHICENLEAGLHIVNDEKRLPKRKERLLSKLSSTDNTIVFDHVGRSTPKISSFLKCVCDRVPVWICARSPHSWDIGHFWPILFRFEKIELQPFHLSETRALIEACVEKGMLSSAVLAVANRLQHLAHGVPQILGELIQGLASGKYDSSNLFDLQMLDIDRRIQHLNLVPIRATSQRQNNSRHI